ncbi:MAG: rhamnulokinase [Clostridiales Family XIII bacterium]|jgi:rhamnulokinase/L-fuculokinase|nr:rhamnulokinase [Clostridiales Family XIII bacterium]
MSSVLAIDLGASGGRGILAEFSGERIAMREVHRFPNIPVRVGERLYWDILKLFDETKTCIAKAAREASVDSVGIDTWGVDFGLIDKDGQLLANPVHYRDNRTDGFERIYAHMSRAELYRRTGIQEMQINTVHQLYALRLDRPDLLSLTDRILFTPDLLNYFLTGEKRTEYTIASTSEMLDVGAGNWDSEILGLLKLDPQVVGGEISSPGAPCGKLSKRVRGELNAPELRVTCIASHDTASAVAAVPTQKDDFIFISCGTWSLLGTALDRPCNDEKTERYGFTNEGGAENKILFMKNIMGSWLIQASRNRWMQDGRTYSYAELDDMAREAAPFRAFIDVDHPTLINPENMPAAIRAQCRATGQRVPETEGELVRCVYESLVLKYRKTVRELEACTGKIYNDIHMIGGGIQSSLMCEMAAAGIGKTVVAGPVEATAYGNAAMQLISLGALRDVKHARQIIANSEPVTVYESKERDAWDEAFGIYIQLFDGGTEDLRQYDS